MNQPPRPSKTGITGSAKATPSDLRTSAENSRFSAGGVSVHSMLASPMARGLFQKAIVESGGSRDSVLTARPMSKDGVDPNYPVSAETIGINFAHSLGIEGTDRAALAKLRALSAEEVLRGASAS